MFPQKWIRFKIWYTSIFLHTILKHKQINCRNMCLQLLMLMGIKTIPKGMEMSRSFPFLTDFININEIYGKSIKMLHKAHADKNCFRFITGNGRIFIHWGRTSCDNATSSLIYTGLSKKCRFLLTVKTIWSNNTKSKHEKILIPADIKIRQTNCISQKIKGSLFTMLSYMYVISEPNWLRWLGPKDSGFCDGYDNVFI